MNHEHACAHVHEHIECVQRNHFGPIIKLDAGEESILLTRFMDDEDFDKSTLSGELQTYLDRIRALFVELSLIHI